MIRYASERFLDIELVTASKSGLKIPVSAVTESEFYTISKEYLTTGGNSNNSGFICESYDSAGQLTHPLSMLIFTVISDTVYYVSCDDFEKGTIIVKPDSSERYVIGAIEKLKGVYCVNTGYTIFEQVEILDANNEYYIVKKGFPMVSPHMITFYWMPVIHGKSDDLLKQQLQGGHFHACRKY